MKSRWFEIAALSGALVVGFHILFQRLKQQRTPDRKGSVLHAQAPDRLLDTEASPPLQLPLDLLLEILARSDPATVARCAATCRLLRRHVADPAFLRRLRAAAAITTSDHRFLIGLLYHRGRSSSHGDMGTRPPPLLKSSSGSLTNAVIASLSGELAGPDDPVASGGGLLVLRRGNKHYPTTTTLRVFDPVAGRGHVLPPRDIWDHLLLVMPDEDEPGALGGGGDINFKVFIADRDLRTQTYSSKAGAWGPVVRGNTTAACLRVPGDYELVQPWSPVVLGNVAHWLYHHGWDPGVYSILALGIIGIGKGQAAWIDVSRECHRRRRDTHREVCRELLLVSTSDDGELALLVWERPLKVSMWTMSSSSSSQRSWTRRVLIDRTAILGSVQPTCHPLWCQRVEFQWFAQGSGTVVFYMNSVGVVLLNLRTLEVRHLQRLPLELFDKVSPLCVYELDMVPLLLSLR
ncbi:hypothetical protein HU200_038904 [Digitaria exilis]|uniref:F-box domain-containing protein n=1 Tax=Digitaria exilis TaxID=1010633 RepID=A0A835BBH0_9POAL|nr:hypothetical protein HU200_038904 [Digitaria exilis]